MSEPNTRKILAAAREYHRKVPSPGEFQRNPRGLARFISHELDALQKKHGLTDEERAQVVSARVGIRLGFSGKEAIEKGKKARERAKDRFDPAWRQMSLPLN